MNRDRLEDFVLGVVVGLCLASLMLVVIIL